MIFFSSIKELKIQKIKKIKTFISLGVYYRKDNEHIFQTKKHSHGRQSTPSFCESIVTADRILPRQDEALLRPTEYPMRRDGVL